MGEQLDGSFMWAIGSCVACRRMFAFDPEIVPSVVVDGVREPLCRGCVGEANVVRREQGIPVIVPMRGAYSEEW